MYITSFIKGSAGGSNQGVNAVSITPGGNNTGGDDGGGVMAGGNADQKQQLQLQLQLQQQQQQQHQQQLQLQQQQQQHHPPQQQQQQHAALAPLQHQQSSPGGDSFHSLAQALSQMQETMRSMNEQMKKTDQAVRGVGQRLNLHGRIMQKIQRRMNVLERTLQITAEKDVQQHAQQHQHQAQLLLEGGGAATAAGNGVVGARSRSGLGGGGGGGGGNPVSASVHRSNHRHHHNNHHHQHHHRITSLSQGNSSADVRFLSPSLHRTASYGPRLVNSSSALTPHALSRSPSPLLPPCGGGGGGGGGGVGGVSGVGMTPRRSRKDLPRSLSLSGLPSSRGGRLPQPPLAGAASSSSPRAHGGGGGNGGTRGHPASPVTGVGGQGGRLVSLGKNLLNAAQDGRTVAVRNLLDAGADPNFTYGSEWTPLHRAAAKSHADVVSVLLKRGADVTSRTSGFTALHMAAYYDLTGRCVSLLIDAGSDLNSGNQFWRTPLHYASEAGNDAAVRALILAGAKKNPKDNEGKTPMDVAKSPCVRRLLALYCNRG